MTEKESCMTNATKSIRKKIVDLKRQKIVDKKIVSLEDFRSLKKDAEGQTVLVVDDEEIMRNALKRILEKEGFKVLIAGDGLELSKILETAKLDMILMDVNLPWVDGYELCKIIKDNNTLKKVPIVFISARNSEGDIKKGFLAGCDDYITKPFDIDHMTKTISKYLVHC